MDLRSFYVDLFSDPVKLKNADEIILAEITRNVRPANLARLFGKVCRNIRQGQRGRYFQKVRGHHPEERGCDVLGYGYRYQN